MKTTTTTASTFKVMVMFAVLFFSGFEMSAQESTTENIVTPTIEATASVSQNVTANETMSFVSWFMGTKQTPNANQTQESSSKKQMMTSGIAPNRLLIKSFLKKAAAYNNTIA